MYTFKAFNTSSGWILKDGEEFCMVETHRARRLIAKLIQIDADNLIWDAEKLADRKARVAEYLAIRASRPASPQFEFAF